MAIKKPAFLHFRCTIALQIRLFVLHFEWADVHSPDPERKLPRYLSKRPSGSLHFQFMTFTWKMDEVVLGLVAVLACIDCV